MRPKIFLKTLLKKCFILDGGAPGRLTGQNAVKFLKTLLKKCFILDGGAPGRLTGQNAVKRVV